MQSLVGSQVSINAATKNFLVEYRTEADFSRVCDLAQACFPELIRLDAELQTDAEDEGRLQVVLSVTLPASCPDEQVRLAVKQYHSRLVAEIPLSHCPLFALVVEFQPE